MPMDGRYTASSQDGDADMPMDGRYTTRSQALINTGLKIYTLTGAKGLLPAMLQNILVRILMAMDLM